jgi:hypothetical protein
MFFSKSHNSCLYTWFTDYQYGMQSTLTWGITDALTGQELAQSHDQGDFDVNVLPQYGLDPTF